MSGAENVNPDTNGEEAAEEDVEELSIEIDEDGYIWLRGTDWELALAPAEARELGQALIDAADDAEGPTE